MTKKIYRISLFEHSNNLAETLAVLAAKSNGYEKKYTLQDLQDVAKGQCILYPSSNENTTCELLDNHTLHLDRKVGEDYKTVLIIEQVDILEIDYPTLTRQDATDILTGIADDKNFEALN